MIKIFNTILNILNEDTGWLDTTKSKPIVNAIRNKNKISFMYNGPRKPEKISVKPGKRINAEPVAIGLSKKGSLIVRAWVGPPSVSKKGFDKTNWRTFLVGRMRDVQVHDEIFDLKPGFKIGKDRSMSVTYVSADRSKNPQVKPTKKVQPTIKPPVKLITPKKPDPKPLMTKPLPPKPEPQPSTKLEPQSTIKPTKPEQTSPTKPESQKKSEVTIGKSEKKELPQPKPVEKPSKTPQTNNKNSKENLPQPKPTKKPDKSPEKTKDDETETPKNLSESVKRIKTLMLY